MIDAHLGKETALLDISEQSGWTDYFIIATANSATHMKGLYRRVQEFLSEKGVKPLRRRKHIADEKWLLIDCGDFVVHLMSEDSREFYDLERLWYEGKKIDYWSKSS